MILCTHCGYQNNNKSQFCTSCGNRLDEEVSYVVGQLALLDDEERQEYLLAAAERFVGRDSGNDIVLDDEQVSARHARIWCTGEEFWVEDLESTNGTYVNGQRIGGATRLQAGDLLKLGRSLFRFRV
jgi:pSer/pThr/pTyr-binding forkhead associated (FHA) protein